MKFFLKNKDKTILTFDLVEEEIETFLEVEKLKSYYIDNIYIHKKELIPLNMVPTSDGITKWIENRKVPKNRKFVSEILSTYGYEKDNPLSYINVSFGLSLNDSLWIVPEHRQYMKWKDYNLYENEFEEALSLVAFTGDSRRVSGIITSPEFTTNGNLKKCWHREKDNNIYLYKGSSERYANGGLEAYCEYYASQIAELMGIKHVKYDLKEYRNEIVSTCKLFTSEEVGFVPIYNYLDLNSSAKEQEKTMKNILGIEFYEDLMFFDSIIYNQDRHLGNFGVLVNNNNYKIIDVAPIFDNGMSLFHKATENDFKNLEEYSNKITTFKEKNFNKEQLINFRKRHIPFLKKLKDFKFKKHEKFNLESEYLDNINVFLNKRAELLIELYKNKRRKNDLDF